MHAKRRRPRISFPKSWPRHVKLAVLHAISLAHYAIVRARGRVESSAISQKRFLAENDRLSEECALLREEIRIKERGLRSSFCPIAHFSRDISASARSIIVE